MPVSGKRLLGLASGGGQQMPIFAALGANDKDDMVSKKLPWNPLKSCTEEELQKLVKDDGVLFSHSLDTLIGGQGRAGLCMTDLYEDYHFGSVLAPTYIATRVKKL